jgi:RNA polymerase sigma factor (sigma-70 family)
VSSEVPEEALAMPGGPKVVRLRAVEPEVSRDVAVDVLFRQHYAALLRVAYAMLGTREAAEDAVQDAFVALYRHWNRLRDRHAAEAYLRSAVMNRCRSRVRDLVRDRVLQSRAGAALVEAGGEIDLAALDDGARVSVALRRLPRRQREVVACRYLLELSVAETAEVLAISDGSVKRHTHRGLRALHSCLEARHDR